VPLALSEAARAARLDWVSSCWDGVVVEYGGIRFDSKSSAGYAD
jgi:hypothetical protein